MKRGTPEHPKCRLLQGYLGGNIQQTVGLLELLFHFTARYCPRGNIGRFSNPEVARGVHWPPQKNPDELIDALVKSGWVDKCSENRLIVHDWADHADDSVRKYLKRNSLTFCVACPGNVQTCPENVQTSPACLSLALPYQSISSSFLPLVEKEEGNPPPPLAVKKRKSRATEVDVPIPDSLSTERFLEKWDEWVKFRKDELHNPIKPTSRKKQLALLERLGEEAACRSIDSSIAQGYTGLFEPKGNGVQHPSTTPKVYDMWDEPVSDAENEKGKEYYRIKEERERLKNEEHGDDGNDGSR